MSGRAGNCSIGADVGPIGFDIMSEDVELPVDPAATGASGAPAYQAPYDNPACVPEEYRDLDLDAE